MGYWIDNKLYDCEYSIRKLPVDFYILNNDVSDTFIEENKNDITQWDRIFKKRNWDKDFMIKFKEYIPWKKVNDYIEIIGRDVLEEVRNSNMVDEKELWKNRYYYNWNIWSACQPLSEEFMEKARGYINWEAISRWQKLSPSFMEKFKKKLDWKKIAKYQTLDENTIRKFSSFLDWDDISVYQNISEEFMREFKDQLDWFFTCRYQTLSEDFMREIPDYLDWYMVTTHQKMSENFLRDFSDKIEWHALDQNKYIGKDILEKYAAIIKHDQRIFFNNNKIIYNPLSPNIVMVKDPCNI